MNRLSILLALTLVLAACGAGVETKVGDDSLVGSVGEPGEGITGEAKDSAVWDSELAASDDPIQRDAAETSESTDGPDESDLKEGDVIEEQPSKPAPPATQPMPEPPPATTGEVPASILDAILADAATRSDGPFVVVRAQAVTWSDGSLGCPEPGMNYTQALVDGYWVVLEGDSQTLDYRASANGSFKLCPALLGVPPIGGGDT